MLFNEFNLPDYLMKAIEKQEFTSATEIQEKSIPVIASGSDCVGKSQTGSGKTFAFGIPAINMIDCDSKATQVLVVCPTRELASQITDELRKLLVYKESIKVVPVFGGSSIDRQIQALKRNSKIVVGTPGRLMDHLRRKTLKLNDVKLVVLDEADEMLDMGFREDIETILTSTPNTRQTVMFSATMPAPILAITKNYMKEPVMIDVATNGKTYDINQHFVYTATPDKEKALKELFTRLSPTLSIVFCNTKRMVDSLTVKLNDEGLNALGLHGDMHQGERKRVMQSIKSGQTSILVATDVAARGIDINGVDIVFNYDIPLQSEYYTHRIGRTGRAGKHGETYLLINTKNQLNELKRIEKETSNKIKEYICSQSKPVTASTTADSGKRPTKKSNSGFDSRGKGRGEKSNMRSNSVKTGKSSYFEKTFGDGSAVEKTEKKFEKRKPQNKNFEGKRDDWKRNDEKRTDNKRDSWKRNDDKRTDNKRDSWKRNDDKRTDNKRDSWKRNDDNRTENKRGSWKLNDDNRTDNKRDDWKRNDDKRTDNKRDDWKRNDDKRTDNKRFDKPQRKSADSKKFNNSSEGKPYDSSENRVFMREEKPLKRRTIRNKKPL